VQPYKALRARVKESLKGCPQFADRLLGQAELRAAVMFVAAARSLQDYQQVLGHLVSPSAGSTSSIKRWCQGTLGCPSALVSEQKTRLNGTASPDGIKVQQVLCDRILVFQGISGQHP
jgi:hypothetical protein